MITVYELLEPCLIVGGVEIRVWNQSKGDYEVLAYARNAETIDINGIEDRLVSNIYTIRDGVIAIEVWE